MKANEAPEKIYIPRLISDGKLIHEWNNVPFKKFRFFFDKEIAENIEYTRTDAFIEKALAYLNEKFYFNNLHYAVENNTFNCMEEMYENFRKYMEGDKV